MRKVRFCVDDTEPSADANLQARNESSCDSSLFRPSNGLKCDQCWQQYVTITVVLAEFYLQEDSKLAAELCDPVGESLSQSLVHQCSKVCFEAARETIDMIHAHLDLETVTGLVPAWWFAVLCMNTSCDLTVTSANLGHAVVYTSATVLLVDRFRSAEYWLSTSVWIRAIQVLKAYSKVGESAERCVAALEILLAKIQGQSHSQQFEKNEGE